MSSSENLPPQVLARVVREVRKLAKNPPSGIKYIPNEDDSLSEIHAEISGPEKTAFDGGFFRVKLVLSTDFPSSPPRGFFLTKIFHPNVADNGDICVNALKKDWNADAGIGHVFQVIRCLLIVPHPESSLNDEAGKLFMESYDEYVQRARCLTRVHASTSAVEEGFEKDAGTPSESSTKAASGGNGSAPLRESSGDGAHPNHADVPKLKKLSTTSDAKKKLKDKQKVAKKKALKRL